jgi:uncharacterized protein (TIRG00374 family)
MQIIKKILSILMRISISLALLIFLFSRVDKKAFFEIIKNTHKPFLILAFFIFSLSYVLAVFRWEMLLKAVKIRLPLKRVIISYCGGVFFNLFLPSTIGGDLMRSIDLGMHTKKPGEIIATVFLDRLSGYIGLVLLAFAALLFGWKLIENRSILISIAVMTAILIIILSILFNEFLYLKINKLIHFINSHKIRELMANLHREVYYFKNHKRIIISNIVLSTVIQAAMPVVFFIIAKSLGIRLGMVWFFVLIPIISTITSIPISIGGLGLRDAATIYFFRKGGINPDLAFAMSLLDFFFIVIFAGIGGLIYVFTIHHRRLQPHKPSTVS